ncbi:MAG: exodeoxyribonuclease VII large subunit [Gammaproteobacteria bacterium]|nr:exodeoxyribonuclease VII large subunit [Gammaproteobacteria bacterium]
MSTFGTDSGNQEFRNIYNVSRLNREVRQLLDGGFPLLWLEAEISNLVRPASGHLYFSLKDDKAQVRCAMFRNRNLNLGFKPQNGMQVLVRAKVTMYEPRGDFQLIIEHLEEAGAGALRRAFDELKLRLDKEGLFNSAHKKPLPALPNSVGVITSPSGAAVRDIITTLKRRFPSLPIIVYPVSVQGEGAGPQIAEMIKRVNQRGECDIIILARGGGSLEDLWAFNEEIVARAIYASSIPIVTGVGHEIDFTIADFVADQRAPTPTAAAELISPDQEEWLLKLKNLSQRLGWLMKNQLRQQQQAVTNLEKRLQHPGRRLHNMAQRLDELELRLQRAGHNLLRHTRSRLQHSHERLQQHNPAHRLLGLNEKNHNLSRRLATAMQHSFKLRHQTLYRLVHSLDAVSPLATLGRGYAIVTNEKGQIIRQAKQLKTGDPVRTRLAEGQLYCQVTEVKESNE